MFACIHALWVSFPRVSGGFQCGADVTYGELRRLVNQFVISQGLGIFDIGCGTGFLTLELAREGHRVVGLDKDEGMTDVVVRTMNSDLFGSERGSLDYRVADFC